LTERVGPFVWHQIKIKENAMLRKHWILVLLLLPFSAYAEGISYSYAELNYIADEDVDFSVSGIGSADDNDDGWNFNGSFAIDDTFFLNGSYSDVSIDNFDSSGIDVDVNTFNLGIGGRNRISDMLDVFGVLSYEDFELDTSAGDVDEDGFGIAGGLRGKLSDAFELNGQIKYTDISDADGWGFKLGALYAFTPNWAFNADYSTSELEGGGADIDYDDIRVGLRYIF
jgi:hypothetical protein